VASWNKVLLKKRIVTQLFNNFRTCYGTRTFITVSSGARHWILCELVESSPTLIAHLKSILILFSYLPPGLPNGFFLSCFPPIIWYEFLIYLMPAILLDYHRFLCNRPNNVWWEYELWSSLCKFPQFPVPSPLFSSDILTKINAIGIWGLPWTIRVCKRAEGPCGMDLYT
jgi:hypothetical protein